MDDFIEVADGQLWITWTDNGELVSELTHMQLEGSIVVYERTSHASKVELDFL